MSSEADDFKSAKALIKIEKLEPVDAECEQKNQRIEEGTILFGNLGSAFNKEIKSEREGLLPKSFGEIVLTVAKEETASLNCNGTRIKIEEESESEDSECVAEAEPHIFMEHTIIIDSKQNVKIEIEPSDDNFIVGSEGEDNVEERTEDAVNLHNMDGNLEADVQAGSSAVLPHLPVSKNELSSRNVGDTGSGIHMRLQCEDTILDGSDKRIMGSKKKRSFNFSEEEMTLLMDLVVKKKNIIECKISNADLWKKKEMAWKDIEEKFNSIMGTGRNHKMLRRKYENMKNSIKKKTAILHAETCGPSTSADEKINDKMPLGIQRMQSVGDNDKFEKLEWEMDMTEDENISDAMESVVTDSVSERSGSDVMEPECATNEVTMKASSPKQRVFNELRNMDNIWNHRTEYYKNMDLTTKILELKKKMMIVEHEHNMKKMILKRQELEKEMELEILKKKLLLKSLEIEKLRNRLGTNL